MQILLRQLLSKNKLLCVVCKIHFSVCRKYLFVSLNIMVHILGGKSEIGAHVKSNLCYLVCLRHLNRLRAVTTRLFFSEKTYIFFMHAQYVLSYHIIYVQGSALVSYLPTSISPSILIFQIKPQISIESYR